MSASQQFPIRDPIQAMDRLIHNDAIFFGSGGRNTEPELDVDWYHANWISKYMKRERFNELCCAYILLW